MAAHTHAEARFAFLNVSGALDTAQVRLSAVLNQESKKKLPEEYALADHAWNVLEILRRKLEGYK